MVVQTKAKAFLKLSLSMGHGSAPSRNHSPRQPECSSFIMESNGLQLWGWSLGLSQVIKHPCIPSCRAENVCLLCAALWHLDLVNAVVTCAAWFRTACSESCWLVLCGDCSEDEMNLRRCMVPPTPKASPLEVVNLGHLGRSKIRLTLSPELYDTDSGNATLLPETDFLLTQTQGQNWKLIFQAQEEIVL